MNGKEHTLIFLEGEGKNHLTIGGGLDVFVIYASDDEEAFFTAFDPSKGGDNLEITVAQQTGRYLADLLVGKDVVVKAAKCSLRLASWNRVLFGVQPRTCKSHRLKFS
jgi:hypothetical protein